MSAQAVHRYGRFVTTPVITDARHLQIYQRGQWIKLAWCDHPSRLHEYTDRHIRVFHYPNAAADFKGYCAAAKAAKARKEAARTAREATA